MTTFSPQDERLKEIFKSAIVETIQENRGMVSELLIEAFEDIALGEAIKEGEKTPEVSEKEIRKVLKG